MPHPIKVYWSPTTAPADAPDWQQLPHTTGKTKRGRGSGFFDEYAPGSIDVEFPNRYDLDSGGDVIVDLDDDFKWHRLRVTADFLGFELEAAHGYIVDADHDLARLPVQARATLKAIEATGVWNRSTIARDTEGDALDSRFVGFPVDLVDLVGEIDANSGTLLGTITEVGHAHAPIILPATITEEEGVGYGRFASNQWDAVAKACDVELGTTHITSTNDIAVNGRYTVPVSWLNGDGPRFYLSGLEEPTNDPLAFRILKGSLKMSKPMADRRNAARVAGFDKKVIAIDRNPAGYPIDAIERLDTWTEDRNWLGSNAELLADLYTGSFGAWPAEVAVLLWTPEQDPDSVRSQLAAYLIDITTALGRSFADIELLIPGGEPRRYITTIEGIALAWKNDAVIATLYLGASVQRWLEAYASAMEFGIFTLDDEDRGLDSGAILGP